MEAGLWIDQYSPGPIVINGLYIIRDVAMMQHASMGYIYCLHIRGLLGAKTESRAHKHVLSKI